jgi:hypothetical protein
MKYILIFTLMFIGKVFPINKDKIDVDITLKKNSRIYQNSVGLLEISLEIKNLNRKTLKYMWIEVDAYNRVDDKLSANVGGSNCKITGPIGFGKTHSSGGCTSYYNSSVSKVKVRIAKVEYMDGTIIDIPSDYFTFDKEIQNKKANDASILAGVLGVVGGLILSLLISY